MDMAEYYNQQYIKYACFEADTEHNYLKSLKYREKYGQLANNQQILLEVRQAREALFNSKGLKIA